MSAAGSSLPVLLQLVPTLWQPLASCAPLGAEGTLGRATQCLWGWHKVQQRLSSRAEDQMDQQRHLPAATALTPEPPTLQGGVPLVVTAHRHGCLRASALALLSMAGMPFSCPQPPTTLQNSAQISHHCKSSLRDLPQFSRFVQHIKAARRGAHQ